MKILKRYTIINLKYELEYKSALFFNLVNYVVIFALWLIFWKVIIEQIGALKDWTFPMLLMFMGFYFIYESVWTVFWNVWNISNKIFDGDLIVFMVRPVNIFLVASLQKMAVMRIAQTVLGLAIVLYSFFTYVVDVSILNVFLAIMVCLVGFIANWIWVGLLSTTVFWFGRVDFLKQFLDSLSFFQDYPPAIFGKKIMMFFTFIIPVTFIGTFPVLMVFQYSIIESLVILLLAVGVLLLFLVLLIYFWNRGIRQYEAFGG